MKFLLVLFFIQVSVSFAQSGHEGHAHGTGEDCELTGLPSPGGQSLAADVLSATGQMNPNQRYCDAITACGASYYDTGLEPYGSCELTTQASCGLEAREVAAIKYYTASGYGCFNKFLWRKEEGKVQGGVDVLNEALAKLPKHEGFVVRGTSLPAEIRAQHLAGATVTYDAFTSSSTGGAFSGKDQFLIYSKTGRPIMSLSSISGEDEVLFAAGTKFRVVSVKGDYTQYYLMREVVGSETPAKAKQEDDKVIALAKELKENDSSESYQERQAKRRWECPENSTPNPGKVNLEVRPSNIESFL